MSKLVSKVRAESVLESISTYAGSLLAVVLKVLSNRVLPSGGSLVER